MDVYARGSIILINSLRIRRAEKFALNKFFTIATRVLSVSFLLIEPETRDPNRNLRVSLLASSKDSTTKAERRIFVRFGCPCVIALKQSALTFSSVPSLLLVTRVFVECPVA